MSKEVEDMEEAMPEAFLCPLTHEPMVDPVVALDGHSYSRGAIQDWFRQGRLSSPLTNERLASDQLVPNHSLRKAMEQRRDEQPMTINPARLAVSEELLGEGSYGRVVAGTLTTGRRTLRVAVKTLPAMTREQERQAFTDEFRTHMHAARHCHGVCLLYGLCEMQRAPWQGRLCIVMKRYEQSLESAIAAAGATGIVEERVRRYAESLSRTLQELHESGLVFRDIKPPNILLDAYDQPVFADFGIAVILQTTVHRGTSIAGTWNYMAPEAFEPQAFAEGIGRHTDVWALACVILEMRTGQRPWADMQMQQISRAVCDQQRKPQVPEDAPAAALLRRCFDRRPTQRPTAADLADAFSSDVRGGVESQSPTLVRRLADQEAITHEVTRVNSRLTQKNARLQRQVEDVRRQVRALQGNVQQLTQENENRMKQLTQENARLTQQLQQQERQRIAPPNGDGDQWWNLSHKTVMSTVLVVVFVGFRLLLHCRGRGQVSVPRLLPQHLAWHCEAHARTHTDNSQLRAQS